MTLNNWCKRCKNQYCRGQETSTKTRFWSIWSGSGRLSASRAQQGSLGEQGAANPFINDLDKFNSEMVRLVGGKAVFYICGILIVQNINVSTHSPHLTRAPRRTARCICSACCLCSSAAPSAPRARWRRWPRRCRWAGRPCCTGSPRPGSLPRSWTTAIGRVTEWV